VRAGLTAFDMGAQGCRSAALNHRHDLQLAEAHMADVGGRQAGPQWRKISATSTAGRDNGRGQPGIFSRTSSGLVTSPIALMATRV
jgi:hypothetical protein